MTPLIQIGRSGIDVSSVRATAALLYMYCWQRRVFFPKRNFGKFVPVTAFSGVTLNTGKFPALKHRPAAWGTASLLVSALLWLQNSTAANTACLSSLATENAAKEAFGKPHFARRNTNCP